MTNLDMLLLKGATSGNNEQGLRDLRFAILDKGIPANSEGMVRSPHQSESGVHTVQLHTRDRVLIPPAYALNHSQN